MNALKWIGACLAVLLVAALLARFVPPQTESPEVRWARLHNIKHLTLSQPETDGPFIHRKGNFFLLLTGSKDGRNVIIWKDNDRYVEQDTDGSYHDITH